MSPRRCDDGNLQNVGYARRLQLNRVRFVLDLLQRVLQNGFRFLIVINPFER